MRDNNTVDLIMEEYRKTGQEKSNCGYLGPSNAGEECLRRLWYGFRRACAREGFDGRMIRLFKTGDLEEERMAADLRSIGCEVYTTDKAGKQFSVSAIGGHFRGYMDGVANGMPGDLNFWYVLEFKTHNAKSFSELVKKGVRKSKPNHFAQMQLYMHIAKMGRALYFAKNKDTEELYAERFEYDRNFSVDLLEKLVSIIISCNIPERISNRRDFYKCVWCDAKEICWNDGSKSLLPILSKSCRQCCHATAELDGKARWSCVKKGRSITKEEVSDACEDHLILPGLISFAEPVDGGSDYIEFKNNDSGETWKHGKDFFSTDCLASMNLEDLSSDSMISQSISLFGPGKAEIGEDILTELEDTAVKVWEGHATSIPSQWKKRYGILLNDDELIRKSESDRTVLLFAGWRLAVKSDNVGEIWEVKA